ncbi:RNA methyltransferase [uncultured Microbacterium sp.]|uniref:TrmH family RNA methyltransferase n=1 Tax=uncultured Microbacterium sp. TaxID=191216 RepID=UPI002624410C|nr:RNA methyltransferase [uncultured Microbacterium sp.]
MRVIPISTASDPRLDDYRSLTDVALRRVHEPAGGLYMAESAKVITRAVQAGHRPRSVLTQEKWLDAVADALGDADAPVYVAPADVAEQVTGFAIHRGPLAAMHRPSLPAVAELLRVVPARARIAVLEGLADHTNVGAVFRSAAALGLDAVLVTPRCADPLYRRSVRVSMGTVFQVPWTRLESWPDGIRELQDADFVVAGMTLGEGAVALDEFVAEAHDRIAFVFGTEGPGLSPETDAVLDRRVTIPMMSGVDSLNVASAAAIAFYMTR